MLYTLSVPDDHFIVQIAQIVELTTCAELHNLESTR